MVFLHKLSRFTKNKQDLKKIYILQIRSKLEQSAVLWHSSITQKCQNNLERVQKSALKIILGDKYVSYDNALKVLKLQSMKGRREDLNLQTNVYKFPSFLECSLETLVAMIWRREAQIVSRWREAWQIDWGILPSLICRDY